MLLLCQPILFLLPPLLFLLLLLAAFNCAFEVRKCVQRFFVFKERAHQVCNENCPIRSCSREVNT